MVPMTFMRTVRASVLLAILMGIGTSYAYASEVLGTLSGGGNASTVGGSLNSDVGEGGIIGGTVTSDNGSGGGSSGSRSSGSSGSGQGNGSEGQVLGTSVTNVTSPLFPNAGFAPDDEADAHASLWGIVLSVIAVASLLLMHERRRT
jgi:hypothetical protein